MATLVYNKTHVKVADELYLVVALLHRENPTKAAFTIGEITERAQSEGLGSGRLDQKSLRQHAYEHAAANIPPGKHGGRYRMVFRQADNRIRLLRADDLIHPDRHQKFHPSPDEVPLKYHDLLAWARRQTEPATAEPDSWLRGLHELRGLGKQVWEGVDPDEYVRGLRQGWD